MASLVLPTLASLIQGQIAYGGYIFPTSFVLTEVDYALQLDPVDIPFAPGSYSPAGKQDPKTYVISGTLGGSGAILDQQGLAMLTPDDIQAEIDRLFSLMVNGDQALQWRPDRYSRAQMYQPKVQFNPGQGYRFADLSVSFTANDPRSYSILQHSVSVQSGPIGNQVSTVVGNVGSARAYPIVTLTFGTTCSNPTFAIATTQPGQQVTCALSGVFSTTDSVVIDCDPRTRSIAYNGNKTWSVFNVAGSTNTITGDSSILPFIMPLVSSLALTVAATSGQVTATAVYQDTWI